MSIKKWFVAILRWMKNPFKGSPRSRVDYYFQDAICNCTDLDDPRYWNQGYPVKLWEDKEAMKWFEENNE